MFPTSDPLQILAVDIIGPLPKRKSCSQFIVLIKDRYSKLTEVIPTSRTAATAIMCPEICINTLTTAEYHLQSNGQVKQYNSTIISRLRQLVAEHQQDSNSPVTYLAYTDSVLEYWSKKPIAFSAGLGRHLPGLASSAATDIPPDANNIDAPLVMRTRLIDRVILHPQLAK